MQDLVCCWFYWSSMCLGWPFYKSGLCRSKALMGLLHSSFLWEISAAFSLYSICSLLLVKRPLQPLLLLQLNAVVPPLPLLRKISIGLWQRHRDPHIGKTLLQNENSERVTNNWREAISKGLQIVLTLMVNYWVQTKLFLPKSPAIPAIPLSWLTSNLQ